MLSPEAQQVQICLLKSNLEEIESILIDQRLALPRLDAENEQKYRETRTALRVSRAQNEQIERLKQENVQLTAKRTQLQRQCEELTAGLQEARENRARLADLIKEEELADERNIRKYEDSLRSKAERFRQTQSFYDGEALEECVPCLEGKMASLPYPKGGGKRATRLLELVHSDVAGPLPVSSLGGANFAVSFTDDYSRRSFCYLMKHKSENEEQMTREFEEVNNTNSKLESEATRRQHVVAELKKKLETMKPVVPENLPAVIGKIELVEKLKMLTKQREDLQQKVNELKKKEPSMTII